MTLDEFKENVLAWQGLMYAVARRTGLSDDDAADVTQEAILRLWNSRMRLSAIEDIKGYCLKTLRNECYSFFRKNVPDCPIDEIGDIPCAENEAQKIDCSAERLLQIIDRLPAGQGTVMRMRCFADMEYDEIADATGYSEANVRQLLSRARKKIRNYFN